MEYMRVMLDEDALMPIRAHEEDAGFDLFSPVDFTVPAHGYAFVDTGVHIELPYDTCGKVCSKSGLNRYHGITADGTIDEGYTGPIGVTLHNSDDSPYEFKRGDKVAQVVVERIIRPRLVVSDWLPETERGDAGFGSTGK